MPFVFSHVEYCDMHFVYGFCDGNARAAVQESIGVFPIEGFRLEVYLPEFTRLRVILVLFRVFLCSLKGRWYERLTHSSWDTLYIADSRDISQTVEVYCRVEIYRSRGVSQIVEIYGTQSRCIADITTI